MDAEAVALCRSPTTGALNDKPLPTDVQFPLGQTEKCCHFSIRGYVADIRKSGRKICGPFVDSLDLSTKLLPPINATKFRWWECPSCFIQTRLTDRPEDDTGSLSIEDRKWDISSEGSQLGVISTRPPTELGRHQEVCAQKVLQLAELGPKQLNDSATTDPSLCEQPKDKDHGVSTYREDGGGEPKDLSKPAGVPAHQAVASVSCKIIPKNMNGKRFVVKLKRKSDSTRLCNSETPDTVNEEINAENATSMSRRSDSNCHFPYGTDKLPCSSSVENCNGKEDALGSDMMAHVNDLDSQTINSPSREASQKETLTESTDKGELIIPGGNSNRKRVQKIRLLSDILNREAENEDSVLPQNKIMTTEQNSAVPPNEVMAAKEDWVLPQNEVMEAKEDLVLAQNDVVEPENNSYTEIPQGHVASVKEHGGKVVESKRRFRLSEVEEDGSSLLSVLKRKIKKAKCVKMDADSKNNNSPDIESEQKAGGIISQPLHSRDSVPLTKRCITVVDDIKKQHAKERTETVQKETVQMRTCKEAIKNYVPGGSVGGTEYRDNHPHPVIDVSGKADDTGVDISSRLHRKVKGVGTDTRMKNVDSLDINTVRKIDVATLVSLYPRKSNCVSVESYNTKTKKQKKRKERNTKTMHQSLTKRSQLHRDKIQDSVSEASIKGTKYNANHSQIITDSGSIAHPETMIDNETRGMAMLGFHKMNGSFEEKECKVNSKSYATFVQNETAASKDSVEKSGGTDSVDGIPVEILMLLQENWKKRHMDGCSLENMRNNTSEISGTKIDRMRHLAYDAGDRLSTGLCKNQNNPHSQRTDHHSQSEAVELGTKCVSASSKYHPAEPSHYCTDLSNHTWVDAIQNAYYYKSIGSSSSVLETCNNQSKISKQGLGIRGFRQQTDPSAFFTETGNGLGTPDNAVNTCFPENQRVAKLTINTCGKAQCPAEQASCSGCTFSPPAGVHFGQYLKAPSRFSDMETHINNNRSNTKQLRENDGMKDMDETAAQLQSWKHEAGLRSNQETHLMHRHCGIGGPNGYDINVRPEVEIDINETIAGNGYSRNVMPLVDTHRNEAISAMNLLRLMDSSAPSSEFLSMPKNRYASEFGDRSNVSQTYGHGQSLWLGSKDRDHIDNGHQHPSDFCCHHQSRCPPALYKPDARIGVPLALYGKDRIAELNRSRSPIIDVDKGFGCFNSSKRSDERNFLTSQTGVPAKFPFSAFESPQFPTTPNLAAQSPLSHKLGHASHAGGQTELLYPPENRMEICVLNRNPADFTIPDDDNEYMIGYSNISTRSSYLREDVLQAPHNQKCFS